MEATYTGTGFKALRRICKEQGLGTKFRVYLHSREPEQDDPEGGRVAYPDGALAIRRFGFGSRWRALFRRGADVACETTITHYSICLDGVMVGQGTLPPTAIKPGDTFEVALA